MENTGQRPSSGLTMMLALAAGPEYIKKGLRIDP
jgi:hypothetical protein